MGVPVASIRATDTVVVPYDAHAVYAVLTDVGTYDRWWPWFVRVRALAATDDIIGSNVEIKPYAGYDFQVRIEQASHDASLRVRYHSGPYAGTGEWTLTAEPDGGATRLSYTVDLTTSHPVLGVLGQMMDLGLAHSVLMRAVLAGLRRELDGRNEFPRIRARDAVLPAHTPVDEPASHP